jgi:hypothetical protein
MRGAGCCSNATRGENATRKHIGNDVAGHLDLPRGLPWGALLPNNRGEFFFGSIDSCVILVGPLRTEDCLVDFRILSFVPQRGFYV